MSWQSQIPGYLESVRQEQFLRDADFFAGVERVAGFSLSPLTLRKFLTLRTVNSPLLGGEPGILDVVQCLWLLHPRYHPKSRFRKWLFLRFKCSYLYLEPERYEAVKAAVVQFLDDALKDMPRGRSNGDKSFFSDAAYICYALRPWPEDYTMDLPMGRLLQYLNIESAKAGVLLSNPRSDTVIARWQMEQQAKVQNGTVKPHTQ